MESQLLCPARGVPLLRPLAPVLTFYVHAGNMIGCQPFVLAFAWKQSASSLTATKPAECRPDSVPKPRSARHVPCGDSESGASHLPGHAQIRLLSQRSLYLWAFLGFGRDSSTQVAGTAHGSRGSLHPKISLSRASRSNIASIRGGNHTAKCRCTFMGPRASLRVQQTWSTPTASRRSPTAVTLWPAAILAHELSFTPCLQRLASRPVFVALLSKICCIKSLRHISHRTRRLTCRAGLLSYQPPR